MKQLSRWSGWARGVWAVALLALLASARGQDSTAAEHEERYRRLSRLIEDLSESQATLQKRIAAISDELRSLKEDQNRTTTQFARHDDLRKLTDKISEKLREVDQKREDDKKLILEEIRKLAQTPLPEPPSRKVREKEKEPEPAAAPADPLKGYEYVVKSGDTVAAIVAAYQQSGVKVTVNQVLKANPGLNPNRLKVGQKVFVPDPAAQ